MPETLMSYKDAAQAIFNLGGMIEVATIEQELRRGFMFEYDGKRYKGINSVSVRVYHVN